MVKINGHDQHQNPTLFFNIYILLTLLMSYSGQAFVVYPMFIAVLILFMNKLRYDLFDMTMVLLILIFSTLKFIVEGSIPSSLFTLKYFFGFIIFYMLFRQKFYFLKINFNFLLITISLVLILEAVLINTILPAILWPNFPKGPGGELGHPGLFFGFYQRPYGIGTNASVTTTLIVCLLLIRDKVNLSACKISRFASFVSVIAVIISISGLGLFLIVMYYAFKKIRFSRIVLTLLVFIGLYFIIFAIIPNKGNLFEWFNKISPNYFKYLIQLKTKEITEACHLNYTLRDLLFGKKWFIGDPVPLGGHFGLLNFAIYGGLITLLLYMRIIIKRFNRYNFLILLTLIVGAIHYAGIFTTPGQLIFAFALAFDKKKLEIYKVNIV